MISLQREVNILQEATSDRNSKKQALIKILKEISNPLLEPSQILILYGAISKHILLLLQDPIEKCRELSVSIISWYFKVDKV